MSARVANATAAGQPTSQRPPALCGRTRSIGMAMLLLVATLFEPHWTLTRNAYDFVVAIDITQSMNVADYQIDGKPVSRLNFAKHLLRKTLPELPCGSRVGWSIFTEYRVLLLVAPIEVCSHYHELVATLDRIDGRMAWANASEVAKGVFWSMRTARELGAGHGVVFMTDGHESPPLNPRHRPVYDGKPGEVRGVIVGVGGNTPMPIPKIDPEGHPLGYWAVDEVMQTDVYSAGRTGSASGERMVDGSGRAMEAMKSTMMEHLSSLRGAYLAGLASELELGYRQLTDAPALLSALTAPELGRPVPYQADLRSVLAGLALALLVAAHLPAMGPRSGLRERRFLNSRT